MRAVTRLSKRLVRRLALFRIELGGTQITADYIVVLLTILVSIK
jgi:hypothetical protein